MNLFPQEPLWCRHPDQYTWMPGYTLYVRKFSLAEAQTMSLAVSADCRYRFYCDGKFIGNGPCRGDISHYNYEEYTLDLSAGEHIIALDVLVWRGSWRECPMPWSEIHNGTGVLVCGFAGEVRLDMPEKWQCRIDTSRRSLEWHEAWGTGIITPVPPMDEVDFNQFDANWCTAPCDNPSWVTPVKIGKAEFSGKCRNDTQTTWRLMPRMIKKSAYIPTPLAKILCGEKSVRLTNGILTGQLPAGKHRIIVDIGRNQTSMIHLAGSGGSGICRCAYSEALFDEETRRCRKEPLKGIIGQNGYGDRLILPSKKEWKYDSFHFRTGRFIELELDLSEPLILEYLKITFATYPFEKYFEFRSPGNPLLEKIYDTAWHTARCCIHEHYEDCPYYEQMQYAGDTRIQALISYAATGEDAPGRQALCHFDWSRQHTGLTYSRYPTNFQQTIPLFSLIWVMMVHDHYRYFGKSEVVNEHVPGILAVLDYFERLRLANGLIGGPGDWTFTDWTSCWPGGKSNRDEGSPETVLNLFYAEACRMSAELLCIIGDTDTAKRLTGRRDRTIRAVNEYCFDREKNRYRDVPDKEYYSIHSQVMAVLSDAVEPSKQKDFLAQAVSDNSLTQCSLYFGFYVLEALKKCGDAENFIKQLEPWRKMLEMGFTTFPEVPHDRTRSECHAWSSGPVYQFITGLMGIFPERPGISSFDRKLDIRESWQISGDIKQLV